MVIFIDVIYNFYWRIALINTNVISMQFNTFLQGEHTPKKPPSWSTRNFYSDFYHHKFFLTLYKWNHRLCIFCMWLLLFNILFVPFIHLELGGLFAWLHTIPWHQRTTTHLSILLLIDKQVGVLWVMLLWALIYRNLWGRMHICVHFYCVYI